MASTRRTRPAWKASTRPRRTNANAGYFDFGSFEEFQIGGSGADAGAYAAGAVLSISVKSGGDKFKGTFYSDFLNENTLSDNVPDFLRTSNTPDDNGHFTRTPLTRGNPVKKQYDINGDIGGPIVKQKAWFFFSYRLNDQYKYILGLGDETERSKLSNPYTFKGTFQVGKNNQIIGYLNKREKLQDKRGISVTVPLSAAYYQSSRNYPWKFEWTSVLGSRAFLDVLYGNWYNFFPLRPVRDYGLYDGPWTPPRQDTSTLIWSNTGGNNGYQDQKRYKPQFYTTLSYYKDGWKGSHDMRFGFDWKRDRRSLFNDQPFDIWYRDNTINGVANSLSQVDIYNSSVTGINDVVYTSGWVNDTWKLNRRLTLNLGARFEHYVDGWPEQSLTPNGHPALAGWTDPRYQEFIAPKNVTGADRGEHQHHLAEGRLCLRLERRQPHGAQGLLRLVALELGRHARRPGKPRRPRAASLRLRLLRSRARPRGCDLNGDRLVDSPAELGAFQSTQGGGGFVRVDRDLVRPTSHEVSVNLEREIRSGLSGRASYVYKNMRNVWGEIDVVRAAPTRCRSRSPIPDSIASTGTSDDQVFNTLGPPERRRHRPRVHQHR